VYIWLWGQAPPLVLSPARVAGSTLSEHHSFLSSLSRPFPRAGLTLESGWEGLLQLALLI